MFSDSICWKLYNVRNHRILPQLWPDILHQKTPSQDWNILQSKFHSFHHTGVSPSTQVRKVSITDGRGTEPPVNPKRGSWVIESQTVLHRSLKPWVWNLMGKSFYIHTSSVGVMCLFLDSMLVMSFLDKLLIKLYI